MKDNTTSGNTNTKDAAKTAERRADDAAHALDAKLSGPLAPLETSLNDVFGEKASYQLPKGLKEFLVKFAPWLALLGGLMSLAQAYELWRLTRRVSQPLGQIYEQLGISEYTPTVGPAFWLSIAVIVLVAILSILAFPGLKARKKVGWNLLFYGLLVNVVYSVLSLVTSSAGLGSFVVTLIAIAIGLYVLFQLRSYYVAKK